MPMTPIEHHLSNMFSGDPSPSFRDAALPELLAAVRATNTDKQALERLGRFVLTQITANLRCTMQAEKALLQAKGGQ